MTHSPFRVGPWEHGGVTPAPAQILEARALGRARLFEVKTRENVAYFRRADEPDDGRVWALWDEVSADGLAAQFAREVEANRVGRYYVIGRGFSARTIKPSFAQYERYASATSYDLFGRTNLAIIVGDDGHGRAREWCGGPWFDFELPGRAISGGARKPSIWHRGWNYAGLNGALANLAGELAFRPFVPDPQDSQPLAFASGSAQQLIALYQAAHLVFAGDSLRKLPRLVDYSPRRFWHRIEAQTAQGTAPLSHYYAQAALPLLSAFIEHNLPVGGQWSHLEAAEEARLTQKLSLFSHRSTTAPPRAPDLRVHYRFVPHAVSFDFEVVPNPSAHQQLEARLFLRDWMRETLPPQQFAKLKKYIEA